MIDQLQKRITACEVFIPVLTRDYLEGPVAKEEFHQALRQHVAEKEKKRLVPVLVEGTPEDYAETFLGNYNMIHAQDGVGAEVIQKIAYWALGVPENPYE